jgi:uroporphyrinogen-III decarboxylase
MTGRERFLAAINRQKADRLPCQVHAWMDYYLDTYLGDRDWSKAYERFGMDPVLYGGPNYDYAPADLANGQVETRDLGKDADGNGRTATRIVTPSGTLTMRQASNQYTTWWTEFLLKNEQDFEIWNKHIPVPIAADWSPVLEMNKKVGDRGIVRSWPFSFGQASPWQGFCTLYDVEPAIMAAIDKPDWMHYVLESILQKTLRGIEVCGRFPCDLVETGGGAGSNTVISPAMHREFCLPYDQREHAALHAAGTKVVYHLCGGMMKMLDLVMENGTDGLETMTPPAMGGDCDMAAAYKRAHDKLFFIGGFDQNNGFERGTPEAAARLVRGLHAACPDGGYICSPSDHFFSGDPKNIQAFVEECKKCTY